MDRSPDTIEDSKETLEKIFEYASMPLHGPPFAAPPEN
jgi:hypothetical protein